MPQHQIRTYNIIIEAALIFLIIFTPLAYGTVQIWSRTILHLVSLLLLGTWVLKMNCEGKFTFVKTPLDVPLLLFLAFSFISTFIISVYPHGSEKELFCILDYAIIYFIVVNNIRTNKQLSRLVWTIVIFGASLSLYGLIRYLAAKQAFEIQGVPFKNYLTATYVNHCHFAGYMEMVIPLVLGLLITKKGEKRILLILFCALMQAALLLSLSRGGILSFLGSLLFFAIGLNVGIFRRRKLSISIAVAASVAIALFWVELNPIIERLETLMDLTYAGAGRLLIWKGSLSMIREQPIFGTGIGTFITAYPKYQPAGINAIVNHAHNDYLELFAEMGIIGATIVFVGITKFFKNTVRMLGKGGDFHSKGIALGALTGCIALLLHSFTDFNFHIPANALLFTLCVGLAVVSPAFRDLPKGSRSHRDEANLSRGTHLKTIHLPNRVRSAIPPLTLLLAAGISIIVIRPYIARVHYQRGKAAERESQWDLAVSKYERAIFWDPNNAFYHKMLGDLYFSKPRLWSKCRKLGVNSLSDEDKNSIDKAAQEYQKAIRLSPRSSVHHSKIAWCHERLGLNEKAESEFKRAVYLDPNSPFRHYNLGDFYAREDKVAKALEEFKEVIRLYPRLFSPILRQCWRITQEYKELSQVIPDTPGDHLNFARFLSSNGKWSESKIEYQKAIALAPTEEKYYLPFISALCQNKGYEEALSQCEKLLQLDPYNEYVHLKMAEIYASMKKWEEAVAEYQRMIALNPEEVSYLNMFAKSYYYQEDYDRAISTYQRALAVNQNYADSHFGIALCYQAQGDWAEALEEFKRAVFLKPESISYRYHLGNIYYRKRMYPLALSHWEECLKIDPNYVRAHLSMATTYERLELWRKAKDQYNQVLKFQPHNKTAIENLKRVEEELDSHGRD